MRLKMIAILALAPGAAASAGGFDESVSGDLSGDPLAPTAITLDVGSNLVSGTMSAALGDTRDYFTFTLGAGQSLIGIFLTEYVDVNTGGNGNRGFIHIDDGSTSVIPTGGTALDFLGGSHLDRGVAPDASVNLLDVLAGAPQGGVGFTAPLGAGTYTVNVQQTGPQLTGYTLDFVVVPAPGAMALLALAPAALRRRR